MASLKERVKRWKEGRTPLQKAGDIIFWLVLVLLIVPGPRKIIVTGVNKVVLNVKSPGIRSEERQIDLSERDYSWMLNTSEGEPFHISELRGEPVFLNFWATWCPPCVAELPEIQRAYEKHGDEITFITVATDEKGPEVVEAFMRERGYNFPVFYPAGPNIPEVFRSPSIPTTFVVSPEGKIVTKKTGAVNWDSRSADRMFEKILH